MYGKYGWLGRRGNSWSWQENEFNAFCTGFFKIRWGTYYIDRKYFINNFKSVFDLEQCPPINGGTHSMKLGGIRMAMHAVHKMLARASGRESVNPGQIVNAKVDIAGINDIYLTVLVAYDEMGGKEVWDPNKVVFFFDHNAPCPTESAAYNHREMRKFIEKYGIKHLFKINDGICHMVLPEAGLVKPGNIIIITDSHTTTHGAFGAFSTGVGSTDLAAIMMTGEMWIRVPQVINVKLDGKLKDGLMAKDVALYL